MKTAKEMVVPGTPTALPQHLSPSSLDTWQTCPLKYRYGRLDRIPDPPTEAQVLGTFTHAVLESLYRLPAEERTKAAAKDLVLHHWEQAYRHEVASVPGMSAYDAHMLRWNTWRCVENLWNVEDPRDVQLAGIEEQYRVQLGGVTVLGFLDRREHDGKGNFVIGDYKTGKVSRPPYDAAKKTQLTIYAAMVESVHGEPVTQTKLIYLKAKATVKTYKPTKEAHTDVVAAIEQTWDEVKRSAASGEFVARRSRLCDYCSYKTICPAWRASST